MKKIISLFAVYFALIPGAFAAWSLIPDTGGLARKFQTGEFETADFIEFGFHIISLLIELAGAVAVILVMIGGYRYVIGSFIEDKEGGKNTIKYALFGFSLCVLSWIIVQLVISFFIK